MSGLKIEFRESEAGFTLLELLVAIVLLSLLSLALLGGLRFGTRAWERSDRQNIAGSEIRFGQMLVREHIEQAWPFFDTSNPANPHVLFEGHANELIFFTHSFGGLAPGGYMKVTLSLEANADSFQLVRYAEPELSVDSSPRRSVLIDGLSGLRFSYFGEDTANRPASWQEEWSNRQQLPTLVRIEGSFSHESNMDRLNLTVAPRISADAGCIYDPLTQFCRGR